MQVLATPLHLPGLWDWLNCRSLALSFLAFAFAWGLGLSWVWFLCTMCQCSRASFAFSLLKCCPRHDSTDLSGLLRWDDVSAEMLPLCNRGIRNVKNNGSSILFPSSLGMVYENLWTSQSKGSLAAFSSFRLPPLYHNRVQHFLSEDSPLI